MLIDNVRLSACRLVTKACKHVLNGRQWKRGLSIYRNFRDSTKQISFIEQLPFIGQESFMSKRENNSMKGKKITLQKEVCNEKRKK